MKKSFYIFTLKRLIKRNLEKINSKRLFVKYPNEVSLISSVTEMSFNTFGASTRIDYTWECELPFWVRLFATKNNYNRVRAQIFDEKAHFFPDFGTGRQCANCDVCAFSPSLLLTRGWSCRPHTTEYKWNA